MKLEQYATRLRFHAVISAIALTGPLQAQDGVITGVSFDQAPSLPSGDSSAAAISAAATDASKRFLQVRNAERICR